MKWHDFSSTQQVLSYSWHCSAGLGSSGSWSSHRSSLRRFSALYSSSTGKSSTGHRQLVTFSNVKAMDRLGITQASFLSSPPQFNTTQYLQPPPILTHRQLELEFSAKAQQKEQIKSMSRFAIVYIHKKIESLANTHTVLRRDMPHTNDQYTTISTYTALVFNMLNHCTHPQVCVQSLCDHRCPLLLVRTFYSKQKSTEPVLTLPFFSVLQFYNICTSFSFRGEKEYTQPLHENPRLKQSLKITRRQILYPLGWSKRFKLPCSSDFHKLHGERPW